MSLKVKTVYTSRSCCAIGKYIKCLAWTREKEMLLDIVSERVANVSPKTE